MRHFPMDTDPPKYPPLTQAALVNYNHLNPFSEVVPAEKMAELERQLEVIRFALQMARLNILAREENA